MTGSEEEESIEKKRKSKTAKKRAKLEQETEECSKRQETDFDQAASASNNAIFTLYVFGFPYETEIEEYVSHLRPLAVRAHTWHDSGKSKGCAHLDFATEEERDKAIKALDGQTVGARYLSATIANELETQAPALRNAEPSKRIFIKNLPYEMKEEELAALFQNRFGPVESARIPHWNHTGKSKGFGYVEFAHVDTAKLCMEEHMNKKPLSLQGRRLGLDYDSGAPKRGFKLENGRAWYKN